MAVIKSSIKFPEDMHQRILDEVEMAMTGRTLQDQVLRLVSEALTSRHAKRARREKGAM